jgi:hypothetical protein
MSDAPTAALETAAAAAVADVAASPAPAPAVVVDEVSVQLLASVLAQRYEVEEQHDAPLRGVLDTSRTDEAGMRVAVTAVGEQLDAISTQLDERCLQTFSKLPRYTALLQKIKTNLDVLTSNAKKVKELAQEVATECGVTVPKK